MTATIDRPGQPASTTPTTAERYGLDEAKLAAFAEELDALRVRLFEDLGEKDLTYIRRVIRAQRALEVTGRAALFLGWLPPMWIAGTAALSLSKILDNMEIGHNVMHGQYDWTGDPALASHGFEWDNVCPSEGWRHSHNYIHHTFSNIHGLDRDLGYEAVRISADQPWHGQFKYNLLAAAALALSFEWAVAVHDLRVDDVMRRKRPRAEVEPELRLLARKAGRQVLKDYVLWPALTGPLFLHTLAANITANLVRNVWAFTVIFCGHFPDGIHEFTMEESVDESRGHWYLRQALGAGNISGGRVIHLMTGNLSHQIEHHLYPDLPAWRLKHIAPEVRGILERYGLPYTTGNIVKQFSQVVRKLRRFSKP